MKKIMQIFLIVIMVSSQIIEAAEPNVVYVEGSASTESTYDAIGLSMVIWGIGFFLGIGLLTALLKNSSSAHSHSHSH